MPKFRRLHFILTCLLVLAISATALAAPIDIGEPFPETSLPAPSDAKERVYLGLGDAPTFTLSQISGRVMLVEMLNALCPHCRKQTAPYNELYKMIQDSPETRDKIKMLGVAVANSPEQIQDLIEVYSVAYPIVSDRQFLLHRALRAGATPFSIYALRNRPGDTWVVAGSHLGEDYDMKGLFDFLKSLLKENAADFANLPKEAVPAEVQPSPSQSPEEIRQLVSDAFGKQGSDLRELKRLWLPSGRQVYSGTVTINGKDQTLFAEVASRSSICDVCHDVHFFYLFDRTGKVLALVPLQLTKYGNIEWTAEDLNGFLGNVIGRSLDGDWAFDPKVDAVTRATMTSAIVFDSLDQGRQLLKELADQGLLK